MDLRFLETFLYLPFGNNIIIGNHIKEQLKFLKEIIPNEFKNREMYDLGCGDGKITILLQEIFKPTKVFGCDLNPSLVKKSRKRGIESIVLDLNKEVPKGELAVIWGVLHHLENPKKTLIRIKNNFKYIFLKEPIKNSLMELGLPFQKEEIERLIKEIFKNRNKSYEYKNAYFCFIYIK